MARGVEAADDPGAAPAATDVRIPTQGGIAMSARHIMQWALGLFCSALAPVSDAQLGAASFGVFDSNGALIGRALDLGFSTTDGSISYAYIMAQFNGHPVLGNVTGTELALGTAQIVMFEGTGCTGQAWMSPLSVTLPPPFLLDPSAMVGTDNRVYVGNRADAAQLASWQSYASVGAACVESPDSGFGLVKATLVGSAPAFVGPFHLAPLATTTTASASVAAVTPAALAFLAAVLMLTGMAFAGKRAKR